MAIYTAEQINAILNGAPAVDPNVLWRQMGGAAYYGEVADATYANMWYTYENSPALYRELYLNPYLEAWQAGGGSVTPTATEMLVPQASVNAETGFVEGTKATRMAATTTPVGNVKAGAVAGRIPIGQLCGAVAIGAGIGIKELKEHPTFWEDLSEAVFNDLKSPDAYIAKPFAYDETLNVIWRCLQDGGIQAYCDKRNIDTIVQQLYEHDAFNVSDHINQQVTTTGLQDVSIGAVSDGYLKIAMAASGLNVPNASALFAHGLVEYPTTTVVQCQAIKNTSTGYGTIQVRYYNIEPGEMLVYGDPADELDVNITNENKLGQLTANINPDGTVQSYSYDPIPSQYNNVLIGTKDASSSPLLNNIVSNLGANFVAKNPNVIYNGTDVLAPENIDDFWSTFADWLANSFDVVAYNPLTNANETTTYVPFTAPDKNYKTEDFTGDQQSVWQGLYDFVSPFTTPTSDPINNPSPWIFESIGNFTNPDAKTPDPTPWDNNPKFPTPTPTPNGSTPTIAVPTSGVGSGNKLYTVYNPSQAEVDALGGYLWTQNIIELISQFFKNNPLEAIISLHMIYCTPTTGMAKNIILGYLDSGVSAATVTSQYVDLACGYVEIPEMYGNALDYTGVSIQVMLPFIGYRTLKTRDVMGKRLEIDYKIDVYTGVCLAMLYVISANTRQLLYTFEGNCSVQIPLTAADRTRLLAGLTTAGVSAFTGNPAGVVGGIASIGTSIDRSGSFSGNAGAMNVKKPFVIITRPINAQASHYNTLYGYPLNKYGYLRNFRGFTRVQSVHADISGATDTEKSMIESLLKNGIII